MEKKQSAYLKNGIHVENSYYTIFSPQDKWCMAGINVGSREQLQFPPFLSLLGRVHHILSCAKRKKNGLQDTYVKPSTFLTE